ncbi:MAG TPA: hypothetical protein VEI26_11555 [Terriglobales bacterium]|nr:hypothetical protein [Terriglobales bacterium]
MIDPDDLGARFDRDRARVNAKLSIFTSIPESADVPADGATDPAPGSEAESLPGNISDSTARITSPPH